MDEAIIEAIADDRKHQLAGKDWALTIVVCMAVTGAAYGSWRSPQQAMYGAIKMPAMMLATVWVSAGIATMLNWLLGMGLSFRQVCRCMLAALAVASLLLAALAPVVAFFACRLAGPDMHGAALSYRLLLGTLVALVGVAGLLGVGRLYRMMARLAPTPAVARRTLLAWILVAGLVGSQSSWLLSPFVQRPHQPVTFWNPTAFESNFFEHLWATMISGTVLR
ncbi:MAG: hypothetical protein PHR35_19080 [Kiritimatiellae bacterium]|nr:hypothetical protein [Kiritimatiellia bacterium]